VYNRYRDRERERERVREKEEPVSSVDFASLLAGLKK